MKKNPLLRYFEKNNGKLIHKWMHYFDIYDRHFSNYRGRSITVLEFGISHGGSLEMWREYFGRKARIIGVDIDPRCKDLGGDNVEIFIGDQEDRKFLAKLMKEVGPIDIVIEDGGHTMEQQIATFEVVYPFVKAGGVFLIEDLHTSYWPQYGGGYRKKGSFIEYSKFLIDQLNAWHSKNKSLVIDDFTRSTQSIHYYDSIAVFEKAEMHEPTHKQTGNPSF